MYGYPKSLAQLIDQFKKMPGIGQKTAQRLAFYVLKQSEEDAGDLAHAIIEVRKNLTTCSLCFNLTEAEPCAICSDPQRNQRVICVVEEPKDLLTIEKTLEYSGVYHILGGTISPLEGRTPDDLKIKELILRIQKKPASELILATNPNVEGEATALYIAQLLKPFSIKITRIARGIPVGGDIEFADEMTMVRALEGRSEINL